MFSGKTTWLIEYTKKLPQGSYMIFKPNIDKRYATHAIATHSGQSLPAQNIDYCVPHFPPLRKKIKTILIDELNFFTIDTLFPQITRQLHLGRDVVGVGLLYDGFKKPFGATIPLSQKADKFIELYAHCDRCHKRAKHSYRKFKSKKQIVVGAADTYGACCGTCWPLLQSKS